MSLTTVVNTTRTALSADPHQANATFEANSRLVGPTEQRQRDRKTECVSCFEIDKHFDFRGLLHWKITRLLSLDNPASIDAGQAVRFLKTSAIAHQPASSDKRTILVDGRHRVSDCQRSKLFNAGIEKDVAADNEPAYSQLRQICKD